MTHQRLCFLSLFLIAFNVHAQPDAEKLGKWKDLKYSMFIHYGIYSVLGGVWDGKQIGKGLSEQIQAHAGIYSDTYGAVAKQFNPLRWNADSIALLARSAGMRSVVITSKHHDGFCMFQSEHTDFDVVDATPFKRDIIKELSDACRRHGLKFGLYFSLIDWHFPEASPISSHNSDYITPEHHSYNKKQVTELLTNYGPVSELWFDMGSQTEQQSKELRDLVHQLQPDCLVSSRIGNDQGDFTVMGDNQEPDYSIGVPWQSPASFFDETWGYRSWQKRGSEDDKVKEKLSSLIRVVSRGGNYLLNIGPKPDGSVVDFEKHVLLRIGKWLTKNGEAIYGTNPDPFQVSFSWGNVTTSADGRKMYLIVRELPSARELKLPGMVGAIDRMYVLSDNTSIKFANVKDGVTVTIPDDFSVANEFKVIKIEFKEKFWVRPYYLISEKAKKFILRSDNAFKYYSSSCIDYNTRFRSTVKESWSLLSMSQSGMFTPVLYYTEAEIGKKVVISLGNNTVLVPLEDQAEIPLKNDTQRIGWGAVYRAGPLWSGLEDTHGEITDIDVTTPWPSETGNHWQEHTNWEWGKINSYPSEPMTALYFLQEITSPLDQRVIVDVQCGDGVAIFLNGKEILIDLNHERQKNGEYIILLNLKKGKNQLLVKSFNNFRREIICSIGPAKKQLLYAKMLSPIRVEGNIFPVSWSLSEPRTPHQNILMQNVSLELVKQ